ncbi:hypothetical protein KQX54_011641, partial [Cotesia glomerata]
MEFLQLLDNKTKQKVNQPQTRNRLQSLRSVTSNNSSTSSFKSAKSTESLTSIGSRQGSTTSAPITPSSPLSPNRDSVFLPESQDLIDSSTSSNQTKHITVQTNTSSLSTILDIIETNQIVVSSPPSTMGSNQLPSDWSSLSTDDKLTLVMKSVAQIPVLTTEFKTLSSKIDDFGSRLNLLQIEQSNTKEALNSINTNVNLNTTNIIKLRNELETIKEDTLKNSKSLADQHALISSVKLNDSSGVLPYLQVTSELVISGIPDSVVQGSSEMEITSSVFNALKVPELKSDILSTRIIEKRTKNSSNNVKDN